MIALLLKDNLSGKLYCELSCEDSGLPNFLNRNRFVEIGCAFGDEVGTSLLKLSNHYK
jgi:hypothetical protein